MILHDLIETALRPLEGGLGRFLRYQYYRMRLQACGKHVQIDPGVHLVNPKTMRFGDHVWIDRNVIIIGGSTTLSENERSIAHENGQQVRRGEVSIGMYSHIGIGTIIQGHGGVFLGDYCTTSAGCKIYSYSNDVSKCRKGTILESAYVVHPVYIGMKTWLGINSTILGHVIGADSFIKPYTLVTQDIPSNCVFGDDSGSTSRKRFDDISQG